MEINLTAIGMIYNERKNIEDDHWGGVISTIELSSDLFETDATLELEQFSHLEIIFYMDRVNKEKIVHSARHPRNNTQLPLTGILAQRTKNRVNQLGLSRAKIVAVDGLTIQVQGLDAIDQTPVLDIKPYMKEFSPNSHEVIQPKWVTDIMKNYY